MAAARLALLQRKGAAYADNLRLADDWLARYFDTDAAATRAMRDRLAELRRVDIAPALPQIDGSLRALQARQRGAS